MPKIIGAEQLIAKFNRLSSREQDEMMAGATFYAAKTIVQPFAKLRAPVNRGDLRRGIKARKSQPNKTSSVVESVSDHGGFVEFGTGPKGAANHAGISPDANVSYRNSPWYVHESQIDVGPYNFPKRGEFYLMHGQAAQPYLYPALADNTQRVDKSIHNYVKRKLIAGVSK